MYRIDTISSIPYQQHTYSITLTFLFLVKSMLIKQKKMNIIVKSIAFSLHSKFGGQKTIFQKSKAIFRHKQNIHNHKNNYQKNGTIATDLNIVYKLMYRRVVLKLGCTQKVSHSKQVCFQNRAASKCVLLKPFV